jgi:hypothetical protein
VVTGQIDLRALVGRLADRRPGRTEANVQSDLHTLLLAAPLQLDEDELTEIVLESPVGDRRRIDVEVGRTVFEVKRDLRVGTVRSDAEVQLAGYVETQSRRLEQRYVGVLTDGAEWHLYHLTGGGLHPVSSFEVSAERPDVEGLCVWLEGVLATAEKITPTPQEIERRLGATSPAHALDVADLTALYAASREHPSVRLKRELWAKLLTTALGTNFRDEDRLFVEHTLLVASAEIIGHALVGFDPADPGLGAATLVSGALFAQAQIGGVVEEDFFDWIVEVPGGEAFVKTLARRLARFAWHDVEHDVMKVLYESVISADQRKRLGEYYTPDWLAAEIVSTTVTDPLTQRVLDPACGSGTFLFHAVRGYLAAAEAAGHTLAQALGDVGGHVLGVDVHPVAVTFARITYLLAIGMARLQDPERPPFSVPVYLGDSVQWGQQQSLLDSDALTVPTDDGLQLFASQLRFPDRLLADAGRFDRLVAELADKAAGRAPGSPVPSLAATHRRYAVHPDDQAVLEETFTTMCELHDQGRDHIWGYYVRNLARPVWLARPDNRVDVLLGNPPWLAYRFMTAAMQADFRAMSEQRGLWAGATVATNQDLSGLFVARTVELYLRVGGRFGFVMPWATLSRRQFAGFRTGRWAAASLGRVMTTARFDQPWDLHKVKPSFFPVPCCVVFGDRTEHDAGPLDAAPEIWAGRLPKVNMTAAEAAQHLQRCTGTAAVSAGATSPYRERFAQGAAIVPRVLFLVERERESPLGTGAGRRAVRSRRSLNEKKPWKSVPDLAGVVEAQFVLPVLAGDSLLPFHIRDPQLAVIPWDQGLLDGEDQRIDMYPGLATWWRRAEQLWIEHRSSDRLTLREQLDYRRKLTQQFPASPQRVVYSKSGMYLAAARVEDPAAVIDQQLYWGAVATVDEGRYLTAILNSNVMTERVRPLQARGEHNPRHFDTLVWQVPIPMWDPANATHQALAATAAEAEAHVAGLTLATNKRFEAVRRDVRESLTAAGLLGRLDDLTAQVLDSSTVS